MPQDTEGRLIRIPASHLGPKVGWAATSSNAVAGDGTGLRLTADPAGAFRLDSRDGSLGRLTLPRRVATDADWRVYLLDPSAGVVLRYDPSTAAPPNRPFVALPTVGSSGPASGAAPDHRRFVAATALAVDRTGLYVADNGGCRVLSFALESWALRDIWEFPASECPWDVLAHGGGVYVLTADAVYRHRLGDEGPRRVLTRKGGPGWSRMAFDRNGWLYVLSRSSPDDRPALLVYRADPNGQLRSAEEPVVRDAAAVRDRFEFPAVYTLPDESKDRPLWYVLPEELTRPCGRQRPQSLAGRPIETNFTRRPGKSDAGFVFDAAGRRVAPDAILSPRTRLFAPAGVWVSGPLDSQIYRCVWDAVELGFADLSAGCIAKVRTQTADDDTFDPAGWHDGFAAVGTSDGPGVGRDRTIDFLVTSPPGRYLWLEVSFQGDGFATPVLRGMTVRFPRRSYLEHLPAVFSEDEQGRDFLERFFAIFQSSWDPFERQAQSLAGLLDPRAVQASHLGYLAGWLGQTFASGWPEEERRRLLAALPGIRFARRADGEQRPGGSRSGTPAALREYLAAVLPVIAGRAVPPAFPLLIEGFRERDYRLLPAAGEDDVERDALAGAEEEPVAPLWGASRVGRFRLGESSLLEVGRLVPEGSPELDVFAAHAHRFRVVVPAPLVATANAEAALRRAIDREKPAHTVCDLQLVGGRFRVGVQSTVGIDTLLGSLPAARLAPSGGEPTAAPSGPPQSRLGYDTILWPRGSPAGVRLGAGVSLGTEGVRL